MKFWFCVFLVLSLLALGHGLYRADYLRVPEIVSAPLLIGSLPLLFGGFLAASLCWKSMLEISGFHVSAFRCIASCGLTVFGKFLPGKVWSIAGQSAYISLHSDASIGQSVLVSVRTQIYELWSGLILATVGLYALGTLRDWGLTILSAWVLLTVVLFSPVVERVADIIGRRLRVVGHSERTRAQQPVLECLGSEFRRPLGCLRLRLRRRRACAGAVGLRS